MSKSGNAIVKALEGATHAMSPAEREFTRGIRSSLDHFGDRDDSGSPGEPVRVFSAGYAIEGNLIRETNVLEKIDTALAAIGGEQFDKGQCRCDPDVNWYCEYCAIHDALRSARRAIGCLEPEPIPPGGGRWASDAEHREHVEATTLSAGEYGRYTAGPSHHEREC